MTQQTPTVVLLAGGLATRLPGKLMLDIRGESMLLRAYRRLTSSGWPCVVSVRPAVAAQIQTVFAGTGTIELALDELEDGGPLEGLRSALCRVRTPLAFAAAADIPNLSVAFAEQLVAAYEAVPDRKPAAVLPTWPDEKVEPLAALYDAAVVAKGAEAALRAGRRKVTAALDGLDVLAYPVTPDDSAVLQNINTPADYESFGRMNSTATRVERGAAPS